MDVTYLFTGIILGLIFGGLIAWLFARQRFGTNSISREQHKTVESKNIELESDLKVEKESKNTLSTNIRWH